MILSYKSEHALHHFVSFSELSFADLGEVKEELYTARTKWYNVGLKLKVPIDDLDSIRRQYNDPGDQLCEMLKPWLKGDAKPNPKWKVLVEVLQSHLIGERMLADRLEKKYCTKSPRGKLIFVIDRLYRLIDQFLGLIVL